MNQKPFSFKAEFYIASEPLGPTAGNPELNDMLRFDGAYVNLNSPVLVMFPGRVSHERWGTFGVKLRPASEGVGKTCAARVQKSPSGWVTYRHDANGALVQHSLYDVVMTIPPWTKLPCTECGVEGLATRVEPGLHPYVCDSCRAGQAYTDPDEYDDEDDDEYDDEDEDDDEYDGVDRRHGLPTRSADWRDPEVRSKLPAEVHGLLDQIADALDEIERRKAGPMDDYDGVRK